MNKLKRGAIAVVICAFAIMLFAHYHPRWTAQIVSAVACAFAFGYTVQRRS